MASYTAKTMQELRKRGHKNWKVEAWKQVGSDGEGIRQDMFGILDIVYLDCQRRRIVGVQVCGEGSDFYKHRKKMTTEKREYSDDWTYCFGLLEIWVWSKNVVTFKTGRQGNRYQFDVRPLRREDFIIGAKQKPEFKLEG